jgi:hypothetical protein
MHQSGVRVDVPTLEALRLLRAQLVPCLTKKCVNEQTSAHADAAVDAPYRQLDSACFERLAPGQDVLVDTVDQCAIQIEQESGSGPHITLRLLAQNSNWRTSPQLV